VRCVRVPARAAAAPNSSSSSRGAAVLVRSASTKQAEAELRWTQQVKDGVVMNVSNKSAGEAKFLVSSCTHLCKALTC
jgi:hypothetical protein